MRMPTESEIKNRLLENYNPVPSPEEMRRIQQQPIRLPPRRQPFYRVPNDLNSNSK